MTDLTQKTDSIARKASDNAHPIRRKHHSFSRRKRKTEFNPNGFYWLYTKDDILDDQELLAMTENRLTRKATTIEQAKGLLRADIRGVGGNAALCLDVERGETYAGCAATYTASALPGLLVPRSLDTNQRSLLKKRFYAVREPCVSPDNSSKRCTLAVFIFALIVFVLFAIQYRGN